MSTRSSRRTSPSTQATRSSSCPPASTPWRSRRRAASRPTSCSRSTARSRVPVGTPIKFAMPKGSREDHTATTGPGNPETEPSSYLGTLAGSLQGAPPLNPAAIYPSDPPGGAAASLTSATHGNGFWSTGFLDQDTATPISDSASVKFDQAGTYTFYCLIHPFMKGTVVVQ